MSALSGIRVIKFFAGFFGPTGQSFAFTKDRNSEATAAQREDTAVAARAPGGTSAARGELLTPCVCGKRIKRDLGLIPFSHQHPERTVSVPARLGRSRKAAGQDL